MAMADVLLVDDDPTLLEVAKQLLGRKEPTITLTTAISAQDALKKMENVSYEAIVSDYLMPTMDGLEFLQTLRDEGNDIPFIIFTGQGREEVAMQALNLGADYYLKKGAKAKTTFGELAHIIRQVVERRHIEEALREEKLRGQKYLDIAGVMIVAVDKDGTITLINRKGCEILEYPENEIIGKNWFDNFLPKRRRDNIRKVFSQLMKGNVKPAEYVEDSILTASGEERIIGWHNTTLMEDGTIVGTLSSGMDITDHKQAEEELKRFKTIAEIADYGIGMISLEGTLLYVNDAFAQMHSYAAEELVGKHFSILHTEEQMKRVEQLVKQLIRKSIHIAEEVGHKRRDGTVFPTLMSGTTIKDESGRPLYVSATAIDITERKQAEEALRESEEKYRTLIEAVPIGISITNPEGEALEVNSTGWKMFGYHSKADFLRDNVASLYNDPKDRKQFVGLMEERVVRDFEALFRRKDGNVFWGSLNAVKQMIQNETQFISTFQNINDRKQAEEEIRRFKTISDNAAYGVALVDPKGHLLYLNDAFAEMHGYKTDGLLGKHLSIFHTEEQMSLMNELNRQLLQEGSYIVQEVGHKRRDGTIFPTLMNGTAIRDARGKISYLSATMVDISERKQAETLLSQQKAELSEFVHAMTHDLKNRLLSIEGYAEVLENEYDRTYVEKIRHLAENTNKLLRRSAELADAGLVIEKTDNVNLTQVVQEVADVAIPEGILFVSNELPTVKGDYEKVSQVFQNLFENAVSHGQPHKITVRKADKEEEGIAISITNDGSAIPAEHRSQVFQRSFTTTDDGSGLGLTIVKRIIEAHNWQINLANTPETTFTIFIPVEP